MTEFSLFATAPRNLESLLASELTALGVDDATETRGGVGLSGPLSTAYRVCLWSRIANRLLLVLAQFPATSADALYAGVREIGWREHLEATGTLAVTSRVSQSQITHSGFAALKVKDAIVDQLRDDTGNRPSVQVERPDIQVNLHIHRDVATISLDLSGESLHRRGYRERGSAAPLKENLAAAILLRADWVHIAREGGALVDPMCGSGTLPIEAALIAADIAPGIQRRYWGFLGWKQHAPDLWRAVTQEAQSRRSAGLARALPSIRGYDLDDDAVRTAISNVERAGLRTIVRIERRGLQDCSPSSPGQPGLVVANPPYGKRLGTGDDLTRLYETLGRTLRERFTGWRAAVLTGDAELGKHIGVRATHMHSLYNGAIPCKLLHFRIEPARFMSEHRHPMPSTEASRGAGAQMFANRLRKNLKRLRPWLEREHIHCYRLYDADLPEYAVAVDVYEGAQRWIHVQEYEAPLSIDARQARKRLRDALGAILDVLELPEDQLFLKVRRRQKGDAQYEKLGAKGIFHEIEESGCRFLVNFEDYLDTGLFLDHRKTRQLIAEQAAGRHFLNLFAYTGTATVCAAKGGALSTSSVDMSRTYLEWARRNMRLNSFTGSAHRFLREDCLQWLHAAAADRTYELIYLDPPSYSSSRRMRSTFDVQRDHVTLITETARLLARDGLLIFANNLRRFRMDREALSHLSIENISRATLPPDFRRNPRIHNCWKIRSR